MSSLNRKAYEGLAVFIVALTALILVPAGTVDYIQAWIFLAVFSMSVLAITVYLMKYDPALLARRVNAGSAAEKEKSQKIIQFVAQIAFILVMVVPALDHRMGWSSMPLLISLIGDVLVIFGLLIVFFVFRANTFTSATIEVDSKQSVISTGPYAIVRHPMYSGALIMLFGVPVALGSWWGLFTLVPMIIVIGMRLLDEESYLIRNLSGYKEYMHKVIYRLVPFVW